MPAPRLPVLIAALLLTAPAHGAERQVTLPSFDRVRVDGPFRVELTTRASPGGVVSGDARALAMVDVRVEGGTLLVRPARAGWGERGPDPDLPKPTIRVRTRDLRSAGVVGGGTLLVAGPMAGERVDVTVTGAGAVTAPALAAGQLNVTLIGTGDVRLGGSARTARLSANGAGRIEAADLSVGDLVSRSEGTVEIAATARFTAGISASGAGAVTIYGNATCKTAAPGGAVIRCGVARR